MEFAEGLLRIVKWAEQETEKTWRANPRNEARQRDWNLTKGIREGIERAIDHAKDCAAGRCRFKLDLGGTGGD
jgi:hypothetical protein